MSISRRGFLASCLTAGAVALTGCGSGEQVHRERWYLFGTLLDVSLPHRLGQDLQPALNALLSQLQAAHHDWHAWKPGELLRVNQAIARGQAIAVDGTLAALLQATQELHVRSAGAFNPAIGAVVGLWGFHDDQLPKGAPPRAQQIERLLSERPSPEDVTITDGVLRSRNPQVQFDLGGYGKGYALQLGMDLLAAHGVTDAVINAGGDLCTAGNKAGRPWRIAIRHPQGPGALAWLETDGNEAVFTSGNYERYREDAAGRHYAHILDPRNGMPIQDIVSATVVHRHGALADAAATALAVAGPRDWHATATAMGVQQAMVVDRQGRVQVTRALAERLYLDDAVLRRTVIV